MRVCVEGGGTALVIIDLSVWQTVSTGQTTREAPATFVRGGLLRPVAHWFLVYAVIAHRTGVGGNLGVGDVFTLSASGFLLK